MFEQNTLCLFAYHNEEGLSNDAIYNGETCLIRVTGGPESECSLIRRPLAQCRGFSSVVERGPCGESGIVGLSPSLSSESSKSQAGSIFSDPRI